MHIKLFFTVSNTLVWWIILLASFGVVLLRGRSIIARVERPFFAAWMKKEAAIKTNTSVYRNYCDGDSVHYLDIAGNQIAGTVGFGEYKHQSGKSLSLHNGFFVKNVAVSTINGSYLLYKDLIAKSGANRSEWACVQEQRSIVSVGEYTLRQS